MQSCPHPPQCCGLDGVFLHAVGLGSGQGPPPNSGSGTITKVPPSPIGHVTSPVWQVAPGGTQTCMVAQHVHPDAHGHGRFPSETRPTHAKATIGIPANRLAAILFMVLTQRSARRAVDESKRRQVFIVSASRVVGNASPDSCRPSREHLASDAPGEPTWGPHGCVHCRVHPMDQGRSSTRSTHPPRRRWERPSRMRSSWADWSNR